MIKKTCFLILFVFLVGCQPQNSSVNSSQETAQNTPGQRSMMGAGSGMMDRHRATVPELYQSLKNPIPSDEVSLGRGEALYITHCAVCHGDGGMGDGPGGISLEPAPAPIAHTSQMMGDGYLFWRITEGGEPFETAMIAFKSTLAEQDRWDVLNYIRALGSGEVTPRQNQGGASLDPTQEALKHTLMLEKGISQGVITKEEAVTFEEVHALLEEQMTSSMRQMGSMDSMQETMLESLTLQGKITQLQASSFLDIHERLITAGLME